MIPILELHLKKLTFPRSERPILHDVDLSVKKGEFIAVVGDAAAGKTMLLHTLTGAAVKFYGGVLEGDVTLCGKDQKDIPLAQTCEYIGFMMQEPQNQIVSVTVEKEVAFGIANMELSREEIALRVKNALARVGLSGMEQRKTNGLSGGQAQRLVLAGILAMAPPVLILDQPAAELDLGGKRELYRHILRLNREKGITVVMVPDNGIDLSEYADRVIVMKDGTISQISDSWSYHGENENIHLPEFDVREEILLSLKDVSYSYKGGFPGCEDISFDVHRGDFLALMGKNGSGKTTLLKLMEGLHFAERGAVTVFDRPMTKKTAAELRRNIGFLFQNPDFQIFADTVKEEVAFGLRYSSLEDDEKERRVAELLETVGLLAFAEEHPQRLSRSQRQKLALASALVHRPRLLIADEPTSGLSERDSHRLMQLLSDFRVDGGTVIFVTHDPKLAMTYANTIVVLDQGRKVGEYHRSQFGKIPQTLLFQGGEGE